MTMTDIPGETQFQVLVKDNPQQLAKRALDVAICLLILPVILILMAFICLAIILDSPGSPFFIQDRIGKGGARFRIYKFRSMRSDHDSGADQAFMQAYVEGNVNPDEAKPERAFFKPPNQDKITRVGKILRKTSLDELPQIINILRGEMSLVGPRPNVPWEVDKYRDWHLERLKVLPGITGLAQVKGRSNILFDEIVQYDLEYVRKLSLGLDLWILWQTFRIVLTGRGAD
jgi:lipopolysaccharide/colanic/teichoic acid biosynthesis glycosyltransferase